VGGASYILGRGGGREGGRRDLSLPAARIFFHFLKSILGFL